MVWSGRKRRNLHGEKFSYFYKLLLNNALEQSFSEKKLLSTVPFFPNFETNAPARCWGKLFLPRA
jgi:hypothetical protein